MIGTRFFGSVSSAVSSHLSFYAPRPTPLPPIAADTPGAESLAYGRAIILDFLRSISYARPDTSINYALEKSVFEELKGWDVPADGQLGRRKLEAIVRPSVAMAELSYKSHPQDVKLQIAWFTVFMIYIDDLAECFPSSLEVFQRRMQANQPQLHPVLDKFVVHLDQMFTYYETLCANSIVCAALEFVNGCVLETRQTIKDMPLSTAAPDWPYFLRVKTGVAAAYSLMLFPKEKHPNVAGFIQALVDVNFFINLSNDILSFPKEEMVGEVTNYVHSRAHILGKTPRMILKDTATDVLAARNRIVRTLAGNEAALHAWRVFENGYVCFHTSQARYRLSEIGLSEKYLDSLGFKA